MTQSTGGSVSGTPLPSPKERRRLREANSLTEEQVATAVGVTRATLRAWETGRTNPRGHRRDVYAQLLAGFEAEEREEASATAAAPAAEPAEPEARPAPAAEAPAAPPTAEPIPAAPIAEPAPAEEATPDEPAQSEADEPVPDSDERPGGPA
ncbi:helix-turn-helix transcriptional regulator [Streptomyces lunaelactis]|uniref:helix-turn-helix transcriptional regulator n=1 Tax=Streptomyces lunaelactis TaxID=1535768 RepID=UPI001584E5FA|nr:helix-turn-helix transcriptional regulator [Streptomyces lunaelactis]NUK18475.1 helix-turn-helix transcriptional regulator [Streptomyces lunaelactis]NUK59879.1 helix-turn-helix transcriptional regulator [Streptomyces lunaelactis]